MDLRDNVQTQRFVRFQLPAILWVGMITASSAVPASWFPDPPYWWFPKTVHVVFFFLLSLFVYRALIFQESLPTLRKHAIPLSILCTIIYAVADEAHQLFVEGRTARLSDVALDASSAFLFFLAHRVRFIIRSSQTRGL